MRNDIRVADAIGCMGKGDRENGQKPEKSGND